MRFLTLGCSGSECDRNHPCSFLVGSETVVDMGSAASRLTLAQQAKVTDVVLSHAHLDHTKDLAFFCENVFKQVSNPVRVRGTAATLRKLGEHLLNGHLWPDFSELPSKERPLIRYEPFESRVPFEMNGFEIVAVPVNHPGGCEALFFSTAAGTVLYAGDTGPTDEVWVEVKKRRSQMRAILLEASFPNRLAPLAEVSGHLTPDLVSKELEKIGSVDVPVFMYHMKAPYHEETKRELERLGDARLRILEPGVKIEF
jgi:ribonuclease BN (tRNA processing enzyme)